MGDIISRCMLILCCVAVTNTIQAASEPLDNHFIKPYRTVYQTNYDFFLPIQGTAIRELSQQEDGQWLLSLRIDASVVSLTETSLFAWKNEQPKPQAYSFKQQSIGKDRNEQLEFDWDEKLVHHKTDKAPGNFPIPEDTYDKLTYQLKIRQALQAGDGLSVYSVADKRKLKQYGFNIIGSVELDTPMGKLDTLQIKRDRGADSKRETTFWLAKDWDYLLVKIHQKEKGKSYEIMMVEGELDGRSIKGH